MSNDRFNAMAAAWDRNPDVHRASASALEAILAFRPALRDADNTTDVLEIGCGTGLLTLPLARYARSVVAVDAAEGMIDALTQKLARPEHADVAHKVTPLCILLEDPADPALNGAKFGLAVSHLVLHHIADHAALLATLFGCLQSGGQVALTDYEDTGPASRRFHPESKMDGVEHPRGIDAAAFAGLMRAAGFVDVVVRAAWTMDKTVEPVPGAWDAGKPEDTDDMERQTFPFLLCRATKP